MKANNLMVFVLQEVMGTQKRYCLLCAAFAGVTAVLLGGLVVIDDVWDQQPLLFLNRALPINVARIITTRDDTVAHALDGKHYRLGRLEVKDGLALLEDRLKSYNNPVYKDDLNELVALLGGHAMALEIAAARIKHPQRLQAILKDLKNGIGRGTLNGLRLRGDSRDFNLEKALSYSYLQMTEEEQGQFRALGVLAAEAPITIENAAAIWGIDDFMVAQNNLSDLVDLSLLDEKADEKMGAIYYQHNLLHTYAQALLDRAGELEHTSWIHACYYEQLASNVENSKGNKEFFTLDFHIKNLQSAIHWSVEHEPALFVKLMTGCCQFLRLYGHLELFEEYMPKAVVTAEGLGKVHSQAYLLRHWGELEIHQHHLDQARTYFDLALPLLRSIDDQLNEANVLRDLGELHDKLNNLDEARKHFEAALPLFRAVHNLRGEAHVFLSLGVLEDQLDHHDLSCDYLEQALSLYTSIHDQTGEAQVLLMLGRQEMRINNFELASTHFKNALSF